MNQFENLKMEFIDYNNYPCEWIDSFEVKTLNVIK